jgi:hypothetical protein
MLDASLAATRMSLPLVVVTGSYVSIIDGLALVDYFKYNLVTYYFRTF